jgi:hypothetical protein
MIMDLAGAIDRQALGMVSDSTPAPGKSVRRRLSAAGA